MGKGDLFASEMIIYFSFDLRCIVLLNSFQPNQVGVSVFVSDPVIYWSRRLFLDPFILLCLYHKSLHHPSLNVV